MFAVAGIHWNWHLAASAMFCLFCDNFMDISCTFSTFEDCCMGSCSPSGKALVTSPSRMKQLVTWRLKAPCGVLRHYGIVWELRIILIILIFYDILWYFDIFKIIFPPVFLFALQYSTTCSEKFSKIVDVLWLHCKAFINTIYCAFEAFNLFLLMSGWVGHWDIDSWSQNMIGIWGYEWIWRDKTRSDPMTQLSYHWSLLLGSPRGVVLLAQELRCLRHHPRTPALTPGISTHLGPTWQVSTFFRFQVQT